MNNILDILISIGRTNYTQSHYRFQITTDDAVKIISIAVDTKLQQEIIVAYPMSWS